MMLTSRPNVASHLMRTSRSFRCVSLKLVRNRTLVTDSSTLLRSPQENNPVQRGISVSTRAVDSQTPGSRPAKKKSKKLVDINGDVVKDLGNGMFAVKLENGVSVMSHLSGKIRQNKIKVVTGDKVTVELSPYDLTRGRLTYRFKPGEYEKMLAGESEDEQQ